MAKNEKNENNVQENEPSESSDVNNQLSTDDSVFREKTDAFIQKQVAVMSQNDQQRYETFRRSNFVKGAVKKYINQIIGQAVNPNIVIGVSGLAKVFVGELVMEAIVVQKEAGHTGPLMPTHVHEAMRRIEKRIPNTEIRTRSPWDHGI
ncbi:TAF11 [Enterospora canceri]|uniref:Transcription initiation factor TFIID subunit 11 n=1 Tax=Enterospora canceri TaxID=1081671 RepID=A0A1Y1S955_9MICR|nr:TAF11 [Enterospora canceri]